MFVGAPGVTVGEIDETRDGDIDFVGPATFVGAFEIVAGLLDGAIDLVGLMALEGALEIVALLDGASDLVGPAALEGAPEVRDDGAPD